MFDAFLWAQALAYLMAFGVFGWLFSLVNRDVSIVDSMWSLMFLIATLVYISGANPFGPRTGLVLTLVSLWAIRLSTYITWRNHGEDEDYRYQKIRANNSPGFAFKSLYIVFGLQGALAWIISLPLLASMTGQTQVGILDYLGIVVFSIGFLFEAIGDYQLSRFKRQKANAGKVLDSGLWKYTRHPNYFGNACIWWGFYLIAVSAGGWWSLPAPVLMTFLLLRVSGVAMLEKDITDRRPAYRRYIETTNAFIPGPSKQ